MREKATLEVMPAILQLARDHRHPLTPAEAKLVIEIDGDSHAEPDQVNYDKARTEWLEERGYKVIRITNEDVHKHLEDALKEIFLTCQERAATPKPVSERTSL
jgi:very-short-patch-repair endonuclease